MYTVQGTASIPRRNCYIVAYTWTKWNKCIRDDTKAAARQSPNCIKNKNSKIWRKTIFNMADVIITPCNVARSWHWFRQVAASCNVAGGFGMTCNGIRPNVRHIGILHHSGFDFDHITAVDMSFGTSLRNFIEIGPLSAEKKWRHVDFQDGRSQPSEISRVQ